MRGQSAPVQQRESADSQAQTSEAAPSARSSIKQGLRGMDYAAQEKALAPPGDGGAPVQLKPSGAAPVQKDETDEQEQQAKPMPATPKQAVALKDSGIEWANTEVRQHYKSLTAGIPSMNDGWVKEGLSAEERARKAYEIRHNARMTCRAMMGSQFEVIMLQIRDWWEYSSKDGPTFEWLVDKAKGKGLEGDAIYEEIIGSANRRNAKVDKAMGVDKDEEK